MAVSGHLHKIVAGGKLCTSESWSVSFHFLRPDPDPLVIGGDMADAFSAWFARSESYNHPNATLDWIKANELDPASRANLPDPKTGLPRPISAPFTRYLTTGGTNALFMSPGVQPGLGTPALPPQCCVAVSLQTGLIRGPAHTGRFYGPGAPMPGADGRIGASSAQMIATSAANLIADINGSNILGQSPDPVGICIYSALGGGTVHKVTGVRVGQVVDTQRRRRRSLIEDYQLHDLAGF